MPRWNSLIKRPFTRKITRPPPLYTITPSGTLIYEGNTVVFSVTTKNVGDGTLLYWTNSGTTDAADFTSSVNSGSITVANNVSSLGITTLSTDSVTEGTETIVISLRTGSTSGPIVANATAVMVNNVWSSMTVKILAVGGGGGGGAADNSYPGSGTNGGGAGAAYTTFTVTPGANVAVYVGGGGACNGGESRNYSNPGGINGGGLGGASGNTGYSGAGGGGGGWSGAYYSGGYLLVAAGGGGGGGGGEGNADNYVGLPGGSQPNGSSGSMTGGTGGGYGSGDGGSAGGGGGGLNGGVGGGINGPSANGGANYATGTGAASYAGSGTSSGSFPSGITSDLSYTNQSYGNGGGRTGSGANGIVKIRYPGGQKGVGGTVSTVDGDTIHTFTTPGVNYLQL